MAVARYDSIATFFRGQQEGFVVELDRTCEDWAWLLDHWVVIDDRRLIVFNIEFKTHAPPWQAGEKIAILALR